MKVYANIFLIVLCGLAVACDPSANVDDTSDTADDTGGGDSDGSSDQSGSEDGGPVDRFANAWADFFFTWNECYLSQFSSSDGERFYDRIEPDGDDDVDVTPTKQEAVDDIKEYLGNPHIEYDPDYLLECAGIFEDAADASCEVFLAGDLLQSYEMAECLNTVVSGTRAEGESCEPGECDDGVCGDEGNGCVCVGYPDIGESCDPNNVGCNRLDARCGLNDDDEPVCIAWQELGEACESDQECRNDWGVECIDNVCVFGGDDDELTQGDDVIVEAGTEGGPCAYGTDELCENDLICDGPTDTCVVAPSVGETCLGYVGIEVACEDGECETIFTGDDSYTCAIGLVCEFDSETCVVGAQEGESCVDDVCAKGLFCSWTDEVCEARAEIGESCDSKLCNPYVAYCDYSWGDGNGDDTCQPRPAAVLAVGDSCDWDEDHACGRDGIDRHGLACIVDDGEGSCVEAQVVDEGEACNNIGVGENQNADKWCKYSYSTHYCKVDLDDEGDPMSTTGVCARRPGVGESCAHGELCDAAVATCPYQDDDGEWIDDQDRVCVALPQEGESCIIDTDGPECAPDLYCDYDDEWQSGTCVSDDDVSAEETSDEAMCTELTMDE